MTNLLEIGVVEVELKDLYLDPNNPRLALPNKPGYQNSKLLFNRDKHDEIYETVINGSHDIKEGLVNTILGVGWEDLNPIIVWQPEGVDGKYLVTEGNRRVTALNYIHFQEYPRLKTVYDRANASSVPGVKKDLGMHEQKLEKAEIVFNQTKKIYVKKMSAKTVDQLTTDLPKLLSIIHLSGPKDWGNFEQAKFVYETYLQFWKLKHGPQTKANIFNWDDEIERKTKDHCVIKQLAQCRQTLRSYTWFESFKFNFADLLPEGSQFKNEDYFLFEQINKSKWFREEVLCIQGPNYDIKMTEEAENAIFQWSFKKPRPLKSSENNNIFPRHQMISELERLKISADKRSPIYTITCYDIEDTDKARPFEEIDLEFKTTVLAKSTPDQTLSKVVEDLDEIKAEDLRTMGVHVRPNLVAIESKAKSFIKMIDGDNNDNS